MNKFKILYRDGKARIGHLETAHGVIETPEFIPVGTQASVKALSPKDLKEIGAQMILANTYHLMLRPGAELIEKLGGLHKFMNWDRPVMTDSGGFQVFSLGVGLATGEAKVLKEEELDFTPKQKPKLAKVSEKGVTFYSHLDGTKYFLGPKESIKIQYQLGADLIVAFDDHESIKMSKDQIKNSLNLTEKWGLESLEELRKLKSEQLMYGVVHGALFDDLRISSAKFTDKHFDAISIGGIYGRKKDLYQLIDWVLNEVSDEKPRHLLGIGEVEDIFNGVERGIDQFDCVAPMRRARFGSIYISPESGGNSGNSFTFNIGRAGFKEDKKPLDSSCICYTCQNFSRAYLRHLYTASEILYHSLATFHNVYFIINLMREIREAIKTNSFNKLKKLWLSI